MFEAARSRLAHHPNVEVRQGKLEALPIEDGELDIAALFLALHHVADPRRALAEAARAVKEGGKVVVVDMQAHQREEYRREMGHVWLGFSPQALCALLRSTGFERPCYQPLSIDLTAKGPSLFVAYAHRGQQLSLELLSDHDHEQRHTNQGGPSP